MHAAASGLEVHDVELLIEESVEADLSVAHAFIEVLKDLFIHVFDSALIVFLVQPKEILQLLLTLGFRIKIHVELLLQALPCFCILCLPTQSFTAIRDFLLCRACAVKRFIRTHWLSSIWLCYNLFVSEERRFVLIVFAVVYCFVLVKLLLSHFVFARLTFEDIKVFETLLF